MSTQTITSDAPTLPEQAKVLLPHIAGYVGHRTVSIGLRSGLIAALAAAGAASADELAEQLDFDPFYVAVWCRAALGAGVCERDGDRYRLAPHMGTLLLDEGSPAYTGGVFKVLEQHEIFDRFEASLPTFERLWWDGCSPEFIAGVSGTGRPFYTRLIPGGLGRIPGLDERLKAGCAVLDTACGSGNGVIRLAETYRRAPCSASTATPTPSRSGASGSPEPASLTASSWSSVPWKTSTSAGSSPSC